LLSLLFYFRHLTLYQFHEGQADVYDAGRNTLLSLAAAHMLR
jgi:hypothetical protein